MKTLKFTFTLFIAILYFSINSNAQEKIGKEPLIDKLSLGVNFGSMLTYGDIKEFNFWPTKDERKWGFGAVLNYQLSPILSIQLQGTMGKLAGIKRNYSSGAVANQKFEAQLHEGSINVTFSLNRWWAPDLKINEKVNFYAFAGIGLIDFRTVRSDLQTDKFIQDYGYTNLGVDKDKMTTETTLPVGLGLKIKASKKIDINIETSMRNVFTDKLDAWVRPLNSNDKYGYTFVGICYRFGKQETHMDWELPKQGSGSGDRLALDETNKKVDALEKKIAEVEGKIPVEIENIDDPRFADVNQKLNDLDAKVNDLANKAPVTITNPDGGQVVDLSRLDEFGRKLDELDNKNAELGNRIVNMQTTNVTYAGGKAILVSVFFEVNKSDIDKDNAERVAAAAKYMKNDPSVQIELVGHADKTGGQKYNELLSERRAKAVQKMLLKDFGIDASRITISFKGYTDPLSNNNYDINRRVDFLIK